MRLEGLGDRILLLGRGTGELATLVSFACAESGVKMVVLDLDESVSEQALGHFRTYDYRAFLYEAFRLEGEDAAHGQLVAAAYSAALGLSTEEEAILSSAMHRMSAQEDTSAPSALYDALGAVEGFRGFYVDRLRGRIGAMRMMEATRDQGFGPLMEGSSVVRFGGAPYPQAAWLAAALILAKILWLARSSAARPDAILLTGAHSLFGAPRQARGSGRLLTHLLEARVPLVLGSPLPALLDEVLVDSMVVKVYSCEAWNSARSSKEQAALSASYVVCDGRSATSTSFFPRFVRPAAPPEERAAGPRGRGSPELTRAIVELVDRFDSATRRSVAAYLAPRFLAVDVEGELDRLQREGIISEELRSVGRSQVFSFAVTPKGKRLLEAGP